MLSILTIASDARGQNESDPAGRYSFNAGPIQQFFPLDMQIRIHAGCFDPVDIGHPYEAG